MERLAYCYPSLCRVISTRGMGGYAHHQPCPFTVRFLETTIYINIASVACPINKARGGGTTIQYEMPSTGWRIFMWVLEKRWWSLTTGNHAQDKWWSNPHVGTRPFNLIFALILKYVHISLAIILLIIDGRSEHGRLVWTFEYYSI